MGISFMVINALCFKEMPLYPYVYCRYMLVTCEDAADCIKVRFIKT